jgi:hypothetical protein
MKQRNKPARKNQSQPILPPQLDAIFLRMSPRWVYKNTQVRYLPIDTESARFTRFLLQEARRIYGSGLGERAYHGR